MDGRSGDFGRSGRLDFRAHVCSDAWRQVSLGVEAGPPPPLAHLQRRGRAAWPLPESSFFVYMYIYVCVLGYPLSLAAQELASCLARGRGSEQEMNRGGWGVVPQSVGPSWWPKTPAGSTQSGVVPRHQYKAGSVSVSCFILG